MILILNDTLYFPLLAYIINYMKINDLTEYTIELLINKLERRTGHPSCQSLLILKVMFTLLRPRTEANQDIGNSFFLKPSILSIL